MILDSIHSPYTNLVNLNLDSPNFIMFKSSLEHYKNSPRNKFAFSHYSAINIPDIGTPPSIDSNFIDFGRIDGAHNAGLSTDTPYPANVNKDLAQSIQNYVNNLESAITAWDSYDTSDLKTPSEKIWWKWLVEIGAIRFEYDGDGNIIEQTVNDYNKLVRYTSTIDVEGISAAPSSQTNEVYILMGAGSSAINGVFKSEDTNSYFHNLVVDYVDDDNTSTAILGHNDGITDAGLIKTPFFDKSSPTGTITNSPFDSNGVNTYYTGAALNDLTDTTLTRGSDTWKRSNLSCISLDLESSSNTDSYTGGDIVFNAIMVYYQVYDESTDSYATNLFGVYLLNPMESTSSGAALGRITKKTSNPYLGAVGAGFGIRITFQHYVDNVTQPVTLVTYENDNAFSLSLYHRSLEMLKNISNAIENINKFNSGVSDRLTMIEQSINGVDIGDIKDRLNQIQYDYNTYSGSNIVGVINQLTTHITDIINHISTSPLVEFNSDPVMIRTEQLGTTTSRTVRVYDSTGGSSIEVTAADFVSGDVYVDYANTISIYDDVSVSYPTILKLTGVNMGHHSRLVIEVIGTITVSNGSSVSIVDDNSNVILYLDSTTSAKSFTCVYKDYSWVVLN